MKPTRIVILSCVAVLIVWDLYAMIAHGYEWTISKDMRDFAGQYPIVPFALGVLTGHLYWQHPKGKDEA